MKMCNEEREFRLQIFKAVVDRCVEEIGKNKVGIDQYKSVIEEAFEVFIKCLEK